MLEAGNPGKRLDLPLGDSFTLKLKIKKVSFCFIDCSFMEDVFIIFFQSCLIKAWIGELFYFRMDSNRN